VCNCSARQNIEVGRDKGERKKNFILVSKKVGILAVNGGGVETDSKRGKIKDIAKTWPGKNKKENFCFTLLSRLLRLVASKPSPSRKPGQTAGTPSSCYWPFLLLLRRVLSRRWTNLMEWVGGVGG
jgi:hypothetical protein